MLKPFCQVCGYFAEMNSRYVVCSEGVCPLLINLLILKFVMAVVCTWSPKITSLLNGISFIMCQNEISCLTIIHIWEVG